MVVNLVVPSVVPVPPFILDIFLGAKGVICNHHAGMKRINTTNLVHQTQLVNQSALLLLLLKGIQMGNWKSQLSLLQNLESVQGHLDGNGKESVGC